ncbi:MAG: RagB/SusD family nutrient uptake outer membrane protein [Flavisolibacter sp.]
MVITACKKNYLDPHPYGQYSLEQLQTKRGLDGLLVGVYGILNGQGLPTDPWSVGASEWAIAGVASDDAYKGTDANDQPAMTEIELYQSQAANVYFYNKWLAAYEGIARANDVMKLVPQVKDLTDADKKNIVGQTRFLRGHFHFEAKRHFNKIPFITETTTTYDNKTDVWPKIEEDFLFAYNNLPDKQNEIGRANKWAAAAYLAKTYMYQKKYAEAKKLYDVIITQGMNSSGKAYQLQDQYWKNFDARYDNSTEDVFSVQAAASGTNDAKGERSYGLAFPYGGEFGCCGFYQPALNLVNAYKLDTSGLPLLDESYSNADLKNDEGINSDQPFTNDMVTPLDPRLDWSVGRRGISYWDWGPHPGRSWIRDQGYAGPFSPKKHVFSKADMNVLTSSGWKNITAKDIHLIRFADVLLMAAEAEIEVGSLDLARNYINQVRTRAANPDGFVKDANGNPAANYQIKTYATPFLSADIARKAVRFERRLEMAMEGHRFFDLVRWGIAAETLNAYVAKEKIKRTYKNSAVFTKGKNEYFPIPNRIIELSKLAGNNLDQNPGY